MKVLAICLALFAFNAAWVGAAEAVHHHRQHSQVVDRVHARHFFGMIDGRFPADGGTPDVALANDLKGLLGPHDGHRLPADIQNFHGTSTSYGGVSDSIGFDPFNNTGQGCQECGPLNDRMLTALGQIKSNHADSLFRPVKDTADHGFTLTPFGVSWLVFVLILWLVVSPFAAWMAKLQNPAGFAEFNGQVPWDIFVMAPTFWVVQWFLAGVREQRTRQRIRMMFPEQLSAIESADRVIGHVGGGKGKQLADARDQVMTQLRSQAESGRTSTNQIELDNAVKELHDALDFLTARSEAMKELGNTNG